MSAAREAILARIADAVGGAQPPASVAREYRRTGQRVPAERVALFFERVGEYRADVRRVEAGEVGAIVFIADKEEVLSAERDDSEGRLGAVVVDGDASVNAAIITGAGRIFSAGGDFSIIRQNIEDFEARARQWKEARDIVYNVINCSKPVVSAMRGVAVGAGLVCGLLADVSRTSGGR